MAEYRRNHYVPVWLQKRFLTTDQTAFQYLNIKPKRLISNGHSYNEKEIKEQGPAKCFVERDLYTIKTLGLESTEIERIFFGEIDTRGKSAVEFIDNYDHSDINNDAFHDFIRFVTTLRLRTPKGLRNLKKVTGARNKNELLVCLEQYQQMYAAQLSEATWSIVDASDSNVKFLLSDHPATVYNPAVFPKSKVYRQGEEPGLELCGTQLLFPLSLNKLLIITNLSWSRNPYQNPSKKRPNARMFGQGIFNWLEVQVGRKLRATEVTTINRIVKAGADRHVAACNVDWLYPEKDTQLLGWDKIGSSYMLMPDPRSITFSTTLVAGYNDGSHAAWDEHGRRPGQSGFANKAESGYEFDALHAFKGEYARLFGPKRRGRVFDFGKLEPEEDSSEMHKINISGENYYKSRIRKSKVK